MNARIAACLLIFCLAGCGDNFEWLPGPEKDTTPDQFTFTSRLDHVPFGEYSSNAVTITGIDAAAPVRIEGDGTYAINGGEPTAASGTVSKNQTIKIFHNVTTVRKYRSKLFVNTVFGVYSTTGE